MDVLTRPLVSVVCLTYNHEAYIRECLDGFVMQKTNFPFIAIVHDDASTDGTADIVREYEKKYPHIIKGIYQKENQYKTNPEAINNSIKPFLTGKYIALCEGDDYWTDPLKLQKQVDFMEANLEYSMCFHKAKVIYDDQPDKVSTLFGNIENRDYMLDELFLDWIVPTASIVYRSKFINNIKQDPDFMYGDGIIVLSMASCGKVRAFEEVMSVYRRTYSGIILSTVKSENFYNRTFKNLNAIRENFSQLSDTAYTQKYTDRCLGYIFYSLKRGHLITISQILLKRKDFKLKYIFTLLRKYLKRLNN